MDKELLNKPKMKVTITPEIIQSSPTVKCECGGIIFSEKIREQRCFVWSKRVFCLLFFRI